MVDLARSIAVVLPAVRHVGFGPNRLQNAALDWYRVTARPAEGAVQMEKLDLDTAYDFEETLMDGLRIQPAQ